MRRLAGVLAVLALAAPVGADDPDALDKLVKRCQDLVLAQKAGDGKKVAQLVKGFALPEPAAWFKKTFGDEKGALLAKEYEKTAERLDEKLTKVFADLVAKGATNAAGGRIEVGDASGKYGPAPMAIAAMKRAVPLYVVHFAGPKEGTFGLGLFVVVDGELRYAGKLKAVTAKAKAVDANEVDVSPE